MKQLYLLQIYGGDIIELSNALVREFAEVMEVPQTEKTEKFLYGTIKNNGESSYVKFDGSDFLTPITSAMGYEDGDRVMVMMKDHRAIVTSNMTSPGVSQKYVKENCASFDTVSAINARIDILDAGVVKTSELDAAIANIGYLKSDYADLKYASISSLNASNAEIENLKSTTIKTTELYAKVADLDYIKSDHADIVNLKSTMITTDTIKAEIAKIGYLTADEADIRYLTVSTADTKFLHADMSDMDIAKIQTLFATAGIVSDMTIKDGHITGVLDSVTVNANSITTGTLSVDRLVIRGSEKSLVYELNNISGALQAKSVDTLNGEIFTQRTITADKLVAKSITSNEIKAGTITSDEIAAGTIKAANINVTDLVGNSAFINSLKSNTVIVGLQNDINGISVGGRNLLIYSQLKLGTLENGNIVNVNYRVITNNKIPVEPGERYVLKVSNYWKYKGIRYGIHSYNANGNFVNDSGWVQSVENNPYVFTTRNDTTSIRIVISFSDISTLPTTTPPTENRNAVDLEIWKNNVKIKLEKGNKATDWTPAPEDVDSLISAAQSTADSAKSVADSAVSTIGKWCYNNNITYINGGKIYTGTVDTDQLKANAVTAEKISTGAITADKIATHSITADKLAVGSITANELSVIGGLNVTDAKLYNDFFVLEKKSNGIDFIVKDADSAELFTIKTEHPATSSMWNEFMVNNFNQISFTGDDIYLNGSVYVNDVNLSNVYTGGGGLFNTSTALFINGVALSSKWAQLIIEYNGSCFGIRNDGGNTYLMNGNTNGWTNYCSFNTNGNWGFPGNATVPGTLTAGGLVSTGNLYLPGKANAQTTAKPNTYIDSAGNVYKSSTTSSKRFKEDVKLVENEDLNPENLYDIDVIQFKYKKGHFTNKEDPRYRKDMIGFIAENVYEHYPMAADYHIGDDGNVVCDGWNEQYLIPAMLKLIQDQHKRILELEKGIQNG